MAYTRGFGKPPAQAAGWFVPFITELLRRSAFSARPNAFAVVLLEKNAAWSDRLGDYSTALEYEPSHVAPRIRNGKENYSFLTISTL
jgi:hypothetical protein